MPKRSLEISSQKRVEIYAEFVESERANHDRDTNDLCRSKPEFPPKLVHLGHNDVPVEHRNELFRQYLDFKFSVFIDLLAGRTFEYAARKQEIYRTPPDYSVDGLATTEEGEGHKETARVAYQTAFDAIRKQLEISRHDEMNAYISRMITFGHAWTKSIWYYDSAVFDAWAREVCKYAIKEMPNSQERDAKVVKENVKRKRTQLQEQRDAQIERYREPDLAYLPSQDVAKNFDGPFDALDIFLAERRLSVFERRGGFPIYKKSKGSIEFLDSLRLIERNRQRVLDGHAFAKELLSEWHTSKRQEKNAEFFQYLVEEICKKYNCKIADWLVVTETSIEFARTTAELDKSQTPFEALGYNSKQGLTGSAEYCIENTPIRATGTNMANDDPRMTKWHVDKWQEVFKAYGPLENYWTFPLFENGRVTSMLRVVNKSLKSELPYWTADELSELTGVARSLELVLPFFPSPLGKINTTLRSISAEQGAFNILAEREIGWIDSGFLTQVIAQMMSTVHRKVESMSLGVTFAIVEPKFSKAVKDQLRLYPTVPKNLNLSLLELSEFYRFVRPEEGLFLFDGSGKYLGCYKLGGDSASSSEPTRVELLEKFPLLILELRRHKRTIRAYMKDGIAGDIYLPEDTGRWKFRDFETQFSKIRSLQFSSDKEATDETQNRYEKMQTENDEAQKKRDEAQNAEVLYRPWLTRAWELSLAGIGAILVITDKRAGRAIIKNDLKSDIPISHITQAQFEDLAKMDGGLIVSPEGTIKYAGAMFSILENVGGARHGASRAISGELEDSVVLTISENGGISAFFAGDELFRRD